MKFPFWSYVLAAVLIMHCSGLTSLLSSFARDKAGYVMLLNMAEEESKKAKDNKSDDDNDHEYKCRKGLFYSSQLSQQVICEYKQQHEDAVPQFIAEFTTPPPDSRS